MNWSDKITNVLANPKDLGSKLAILYLEYLISERNTQPFNDEMEWGSYDVIAHEFRQAFESQGLNPAEQILVVIDKNLEELSSDTKRRHYLEALLHHLLILGGSYHSNPEIEFADQNAIDHQLKQPLNTRFQTVLQSFGRIDRSDQNVEEFAAITRRASRWRGSILCQKLKQKSS